MVSNSRPGARERVSHAEARALTRRRLLEAAGQLFRRVGYHAATLEQVAADAGYTKGAVYSAFASKADLFLEFVSARARARREQLGTLEATTRSFEAFAEAAAHGMAESATREADYWASVIEFMTVVARDPHLRRRYAAHHDATRDALGALIERRARASGRELALPAHTVASIVLAVTNGLTLERMVSPHSLSAAASVRAQVALMQGLSRPSDRQEEP